MKSVLIHTFFLFSLMLAASQTPSGTKPQADEEALYKKVSAASFEVLVGGQLAGSGWFNHQSGWGFTALHVVKNSRAIRVKQGRKTWRAELFACDAAHDLALLKIHGEHPVGLTTQPKFPKVGATLYLHGAPLFRHGIWFSGKVASDRVAYEYLGGDAQSIRCRHVLAAAPKGVSGGAWVNGKGEVVGLQSGTMTLGNAQQGLAFVTPADAVKNLLENKKNAAVSSLGCAYEEICEQSPKWIARLPQNQHGVVVKALRKGGPLDAAGIANDAVITHIGGKAVHNRNDAYALTHALIAGKKTRLKLLEGKQSREVVVTPQRAFENK